MTLDTLHERIQAAALLLTQAQYVVAFSGAGISTDSGIPDFRSHHSGLWQNSDPMRVASIYGFKRDPQAFYDWVRPLAQVTLDALPNDAHYALAALEQQGRLHSIITQNIDMLHTRAGNRYIHELHGHLRLGTCIHCFAVYDGITLLTQFLEDGEVPRCDKCRSPIKPNVILFGEQLPVSVLMDAQEESRRCDLMIAIGSSLEVAPASNLPFLATRTGAKLIIINLEETPADHLADIVIRGRAAEILPQIVRHLEHTA
jgi:NAD-dependent deacetylase